MSDPAIIASLFDVAGRCNDELHTRIGYNPSRTPFPQLNDRQLKREGEVQNEFISRLENIKLFENTVPLSIKGSDEADTTIAITRQIMCAFHGYAAVPQPLKQGLLGELRQYVTSQFLG